MNPRALLQILLSLAALWSAATAPAMAQAGYPNRPIRIVVPFPTGGMADILPRILAERLAVVLGQPIVIENRPGATGNVGTEAVAAARPDGYTLLASPPPPLAINESLFPRLGFDPASLVPITVIAQVDNVLAVSAALPVDGVAELIARAKRDPRGLTYESTGTGGTPHLSGELLRLLGSAPLVHVPYRGIAQAIPDLAAGRVDLMFLNLGDALPHVRRGALKIIGVGGAARHPAIPDVPTIAEAVPGFLSTTWYALVAPSGTPPDVTQTLWEAIARVVQEPAVAAKLRDANLQTIASPPSVASAFIRAEAQRWGQLIRSTGIKPD